MNLLRFFLLHSSDIIRLHCIDFTLKLCFSRHSCVHVARSGGRNTMTTNSNSAGPPARTPEEYYTALYQAALTISSSLELEEVLQSVAKSITQAMQVKACSLRLLNERTGQLQMGAVYGLSSSYLAKGPVEVERSPLDSAALKAAPVFIPD